jgi:polyketide synthase PksJ
MQETIAAVWKKALHRETIGIFDNFFESGGNSLLIIAVHSQLKNLTRHLLKVTDLFKYPTVDSLSAFLESHGAASQSAAPQSPSHSRLIDQTQKREQRRLRRGRITLAKGI